jgi:hypothetical protein
MITPPRILATACTLAAFSSCLGTDPKAADGGFDAAFAVEDSAFADRDASAPSVADARSEAHEAAPAKDAALPPVTLDGALPEECGGGTPPRAADAGRPDCMPGCLWDIVKDCPPPATCERPRPGRREVLRDCDVSVQGQCSVSIDVYMEDRLCYTYSFPKLPVRGGAWTSSVRGSDGRKVTLLTLGDLMGTHTWAMCEPCVYPDAPMGISLPPFLQCDGGSFAQYLMDFTRPECSP